MSAYYEAAQWTGPPGQSGWEHQTPPPARSGASSAIPREESTAFLYQFEEVDRAIDNLVKSGKMFGGMQPMPAGRYGRTGPPRPPSVAEYGEARGPPSNLQNFYANQRHQPSRGSNEAEHMIQAKRRMAAQRERELRNYHQEQQYNRTVLSGVAYGDKPDRALSPGNMSEEDRRKFIAQQRSALYGEGPSPLAYEYGRAPPVQNEAGPQTPTEGGQGSQSAGPNEQSRANSNSSPQSNPGTGIGVFDASGAQHSSRTSASSPGGSPPRPGGVAGIKPGQGSVAPIGTRPSVSSAPSNPALNKRSTTPLPSPLSQGYTASNNDNGSNTTATTGSNPPSAAPVEGSSAGLSGWGARPNGWGNKPGLGVQASVWG
ncbi:hypothetical protein V8F20_004656 [Naviculisporaceae sp. PSN 640]